MLGLFLEVGVRTGFRPRFQIKTKVLFWRLPVVITKTDLCDKGLKVSAILWCPMVSTMVSNKLDTGQSKHDICLVFSCMAGAMFFFLFPCPRLCGSRWAHLGRRLVGPPEPGAATLFKRLAVDLPSATSLCMSWSVASPEAHPLFFSCVSSEEPLLLLLLWLLWFFLTPRVSSVFCFAFCIFSLTYSVTCSRLFTLEFSPFILPSCSFVKLMFTDLCTSFF